MRLVMNLLGRLHLIVAASFVPSALWSFYYHETAMLTWLLVSAALTASLGALLLYTTRRAPTAFYQREALALVCFSWIATGILGALPFGLSGALPWIPALFESFSGFTTCGASVLDDIEALPRGLLFWRSFTHWVGGIGILAIMLIVLPHLGTGGKMLLRFESSQGIPKGLRERMRKSVYAILIAYLALTVAQVLALLLTRKMDLFDALCHTFGTLATGGYSTRQASIAAYDSVAVETIIIFFMVCGATSFSLHSFFLRGDLRAFFRDSEWRFYIMVLMAAVLVCTLNLSGWFGHAPLGAPSTESSGPMGFAHALRVSAFNVTSVFTNTGFATDDFDRWPFFSRAVLLLLMTIGGCAGSTAGGIKAVRILILAKLLWQKIERSFRPRIVRAARISGDPVSNEVLFDVAAFFAAYMAVFVAGALVMSAWGLPLDSALSSVLACMSCTGPGLELVGPGVTYSCIPNGGLISLIVLMLLGRLELFTFLVLVVPAFWQTGK